MNRKFTIFLPLLLCSFAPFFSATAQSSENFDEVPLTDDGGMSSFGITNPRVIGSWSFGLLDASGAYSTDIQNNYVDVTNRIFTQSGTNLANGSNDKALHLMGRYTGAEYADVKSANGGKFKLNSFAFDAFPTAWTVTGYSGGVQVVSQNFTTLSNMPNTLQFTAPGWSSIDEFRISQQNGEKDIQVFMDDINVGRPQVTTTAIQSISRTSPPFTNASTVTYTATFSSAVTGLSAGNFSLSTTAGQSNASIGSVSGSGTTYTIVVNTGSGDGTLTLNLANAAGLSPGISTTLPFSGDQYIVDKTAPAVTSVSTPPDGNYGIGTALQFVLSFSEPAQVNTQGGTPRIALTIGSQTRYASYVTGSGTYQLVFIYSIQPGDLDLDGIQVTPTLLLNGGTMTDGAGNNANLALNNLPGTQGIIVDAVAPSVTLSTTATSPVQGPFTVKIVFSQPVTGLTAGDITAANATVTNLQTTDQTNYTALVTPATSGQQVSVSLPASAATNVTLMGNTASNILTLQYISPQPVIGNLSGDHVTYTEGTAPVTLDNGDDATLTDAGTGSFNGGNLAVSITGNQQAGQDVLGIDNVGTAPGEISVSGTSVSYGGALIGVVSGGANGSDLLVSLNTGASTAAVQALIRSITYNNTSLNPNTDPRTVGFTVTDADSRVSDIAAVTVNVTAVNSRPQAARDTITVQENGVGTGNVKTNDSDPEGNALTSSLVTAPVNGTVVLNADGSFTYTPNAFYAGTDSLIYQVCDNGNPSKCDTSTLIILVQAVPPPVVTTTAGATSFTAGSAPVTVDPGVTVQAPGYSTLDAARVSITNPYISEDNLNFVNDPATMGNIQSTYNSLTGVMTLASNGVHATVAQWQAALRSVQYQNTSPTPHTATRNISFAVTVGPLTSADATKNVTISIPNNNPPVITPGQSWSIDELSANGTAVGTVAVTDADGPTTFSAWTITAGNTGSAFAVDAATGKITVADGSKLDYNTTPSYTLTLTVSDGVNTSAPQTVKINLNNINNNPPVITPGQSWSIDENSANGTAVGTVAATDADGPTTTFSAWTITAGNTGSAFAIDAATGKITVADGSKLDYNTTPSYTLTLTVSDGLNTSAPQTVQVNLNNLNNNPPVITPGQAWSIDELSANGTAVGTAAATDADGPTTYSAWTITAGNMGGAFAIDPSTGKITVADGTKLDYGTTPSFTLTLTVSDGVNTSAPQTVKINLNNINNNPPVITPGQSWSIDELSADGTAVGTVATTDADGPTTFSNWTITAGNTGGAFAIDAATGKITVVDGSKLDYNTTPSFTLTLTVSDETNTSAPQTVKINLNNINNNPPVITPGQSWSIDENSANGTAVGTVAATDADGATTFSAWTITAGNTGNAFAIDASTGKITVADGAKLDYETLSGYMLTLTVSDGLNTSALQTVAINLKDVHEAPTDLSFVPEALYENQPAQTPAGKLGAAGQDAGSTITYSLATGAGDDDNASFGIDGTSLVTSAPLDYEKKSAYKVRVRASTQYGLFVEKAITVEVLNVNEAPTLDAVSDETLCFTTDRQRIRLKGITPGEDAGQTTTVTVAADHPELFSDLSVSSGNLNYRLRPGAGGSAVVTVTVKDDGGVEHGGVDTFERSFTVTVNPVPVIAITADSANPVSKGLATRLTASGALSYRWDNGPGIQEGWNEATLMLRPQQDATYTVTGTSAEGCSAQQQYTLNVIADYKLVCNNILSPNGDGKNDRWIIQNIDSYPNNQVKVFDRSGRIVYQKSAYDNQWDGRINGGLLASGTYYYIFVVDGGKKVFKGYIEILNH